MVPDAKQPLHSLQGTIATGEVATIISYGSLRFPVPVGGENALRVRVNLLAEPDVIDWKVLTAIVRSDSPPQDPAEKRTWEMLQGKLEEVRPDKVPLKRAMPEVVGALNELLRRPDFYSPDAGKERHCPRRRKSC